MANKIILKKSSEASKAPQTSDLDYGELALNFTDGKLYFKNSSNVIKRFSDTTVITSASAPQYPLAGDLWWDTDTGTLFVYYYDGLTYQWVETTPQILVEGPSGTFTLTGNLITTGDVTVQGTLYETSDIKLKKDVKTIDNAVDTVLKLRGVTFNWIKNNKESMGLIAQETEKVIPYIVQEDPTGAKSINYTALIGILVESIKELNAKIAALEGSQINNSVIPQKLDESSTTDSVKQSWWSIIKGKFLS